MTDELLLYPVEPPRVWSALWIAPHDSGTARDVFFRARCRFRLTDGTGRNALLYVAAESSYHLYVNGTFVGAGPVRGSAMCNFFDTFDVSSRLVPGGENTVALLVSCANVPSFKYAPARPALLLQLGEGDACATGVAGEWEIQEASDFRPDAPVFTFQMGFAERRDLRREPSGWEDGTGGGGFAPPLTLAPAESLGGKRLLPRDIPALRERVFAPILPPVTLAAVPPVATGSRYDVAERLTAEPHHPLREPIPSAAFPLTVSRRALPHEHGVVIVFDFGREVVGGFALDIDASEGTRVDVGYEETLCDGRTRVFLQNGADTRYALADHYVLCGGRQRIASHHERGFRYLQIAIRRCDTPFTIHSLEGIDRRYPCAESGAAVATFFCDDERFNRLFAVCRETLSACATDTFIDCPWRENALWVNDLLTENVLWLRTFGDARINRRSLRLALSEQRADGFLAGVCPSDGDDRHVLFPTNLFFPAVVADYVLYTGDTAFAREVLPALLRQAAAVTACEDDNGILLPPVRFWNFVDWSYPFCGVELNGRPSAVVSLLRVAGTRALARVCEYAGERDAAARFLTEAARLSDAAHNAFWDPERGRYREFLPSGKGGREDEPVASQLTHALALLWGDTPALRPLLADAVADDTLLAPELYLQHITQTALLAEGRTDVALERLSRFWLPMIALGEPTIWEANVHQGGKAAFRGTGSLCHGFATTPVAFLQGAVLGISPTAPGYRRFGFAPTCLDLRFATGTVPTPLGAITARWDRESGDPNAVTVCLSVPEGAVADVNFGDHTGEAGGGNHTFRVRLDQSDEGSGA